MPRKVNTSHSRCSKIADGNFGGLWFSPHSGQEREISRVWVYNPDYRFIQQRLNNMEKIQESQPLRFYPRNTAIAQ